MANTIDQVTVDVLDESENRYRYDQQVPVFLRGAEGKRIDVQGRELGREGFSFEYDGSLPVGALLSVYVRSTAGEILPAVDATVVESPGPADRVDVRFASPIDLARFVEAATPLAG